MKFFSIIKTFDKKQWSGYITYLGLYYKPDGIVCKLANWFDDQSIWKTYEEREFSTGLLISKLPFEISRQTLSNTLSKLGNTAEEYVGWMVWRDSSNLKQSCQLLGLAQRSLSDQYLSAQSKILRNTENNFTSVWDEHYKMQALFNDYYFGISSSENNHLDEFTLLIDSFLKSTATIAQLLFVEIQSREKLLSESWTAYSEFFNILYQPNTELKNITDHLILMNQKGDQGAFDFLLNFLKTNETKNISKLIKYSIVMYCVNFLTRIVRKGHLNRVQELLDLYEYSLEKGIFTLNYNMPLKRFINIINIASKLGKFEWSRKIIDKWAHRVDEKNYKNVAKFGYATIEFQQKKYENVVETLSQMKSENFDHRLRARWLLLIAQFELNKDYVSVVKSQVDNFRRFMASNEYRMNWSTYQSIMASVKILNMILNRRERHQIEEFYRSSRFVFERKWIFEKIKKSGVKTPDQ